VRVIMVTAPPAVLRARLEARGREARDAIDARADRTVAVAADVTIVNDGAPEAAVRAFLSALQG
jgi:ribose 1,5-bisphosphokinase